MFVRFFYHLLAIELDPVPNNTTENRKIVIFFKALTLELT